MCPKMRYLEAPSPIQINYDIIIFLIHNYLIKSMFIIVEDELDILILAF